VPCTELVCGMVTNGCWQNIKEGIEGKPVGWYSDVFKIVFPDVDRDVANKMWEKELKGERKGGRKKKEHKRKEEDEEESGEEDD
jgi:Lon-like ATP-dependent protease